MKVFLERGPRAGVARLLGREGTLGFLSARMEMELRGAGGLLLCEGVLVLSSDAWPLTGDLKGVLNGERKGFASVWEAASMRRRLAAGVDILTVIVIVILVAILRQR